MSVKLDVALAVLPHSHTLTHICGKLYCAHYAAAAGIKCLAASSIILNYWLDSNVRFNEKLSNFTSPSAHHPFTHMYKITYIFYIHINYVLMPCRKNLKKVVSVIYCSQWMSVKPLMT